MGDDPKHPVHESVRHGVEPYDAVLSFHQLVKNADESMLLDNEALYNISFRSRLQHTGVLSNFTVNPHSLPSAHLTSRGSQQHRALTWCQNSRSRCFDAEYMCPAEPRHGRCLTASALFRGRVSTKDVDEQAWNPQNKNSTKCSRGLPSSPTTDTSTKFTHVDEGVSIPMTLPPGVSMGTALDSSSSLCASSVSSGSSSKVHAWLWPVRGGFPHSTDPSWGCSSCRPLG